MVKWENYNAWFIQFDRNESTKTVAEGDVKNVTIVIYTAWCCMHFAYI